MHWFEALSGPTILGRSWTAGLALGASALLFAQPQDRPHAPAQSGANPYTHWNRSWEVAFQPGAALLAGGSTDQPQLQLWKVPELEPLRSFGAHTESIEALAWHPEGQWLASGSRDRTVKIWDSESGRELHTLASHDGWVWDLAWSPDGRRLASASYDGTVKIWAPQSGQLLETLAASELPLFAVAWSRDGRLLAAGGKEGPIWIWDGETLAPRAPLTGHRSGVACLRFAGKDKLASGGWDRLVKIWSAADGKQLLELGGHRGSIHELATSPDGRLVASISTDTTLIVWDCDQGALVQRIFGHSEGMRSLDWSSDGRYLIAVEWKVGRLRLFATDGWTEVRSAAG
jgi:WD40 repeat protein